MKKWKHVIDIKEAFQKSNEDETFESALALVSLIIFKLNSLASDCSGFSDLEEIIENFELISENLEDKTFENIQEFQDEFNYAFNMLYDYADDKRIWIRVR